MVRTTETSNRARFRSCNTTVDACTSELSDGNRLLLVNILSAIRNCQDCPFQQALHPLLELGHSDSHIVFNKFHDFQAENNNPNTQGIIIFLAPYKLYYNSYLLSQ